MSLKKYEGITQIVTEFKKKFMSTFSQTLTFVSFNVVILKMLR